MKALVKKYAEEGLWLEDVPIPEIAGNEVLIKIHKTAICGTDVHIYNWDDWAQKTINVPMVSGHEYAGEIVEIGANVTGLNIGDIVSGEGSYCLWALPQLPSRAATPLPQYPRALASIETVRLPNTLLFRPPMSSDRVFISHLNC
jgi:NADPH:quinone reductase-like Zn-dependent oxidoreductase